LRSGAALCYAQRAMRVGVIGLGAIGGVVAARLLRRPVDGEIVALAAGRSAQAIARSGLRVDGEAPVATPRVSEKLPADLAPYDLALLCTRTDAMDAALASAAPLLARDGAIVCLQNGLPEERAARIVGPQRVLGAVIGWSASMRTPGEYEITGGGKFTLGGSSPRLREAQQLLARAFPVKLTANLAGARWSKLAMNCALSTLGAISGLDFGGLAASGAARRVAVRAIREAVAVARAKGVRLERVAGVDPAWATVRGPLPHLLIWLAARLRPRQRSGMLRRLLAGLPAGQVDDVNGAVVHAAREVGLEAPLNARLVELVHAIERGEERIGTHQLERLAAPDP
jgi:2-dehydropantoate 2-reductase